MNSCAAMDISRAVVRAMIGTGHRAFPGKTGARTGQRDNACEDCAEKREKDDRLIHALALHQIDVLNRDRAAVAVEHDQNGKPDRRFRRCNRQHQQRVDLSNDVAKMGREGDEIDVDCEQDQLDRHQDDDDVFAVQENTEDPQREQDCGNRQKVTEANGHVLLPRPCPDRTFTTSIEAAGVRATCSEISWRRTRTRCWSVSTMAPPMATRSIMPAASKKWT